MMKELVLEVTQGLPDTATLEDIIEAIYIKLKAEKGIKEVEDNKEMTTEELLEVIKTWK